MCGRFSNDKNVDDLAKEYQARGGRGDDFMARWSGLFSIAPTDPVPIVREYLDKDDGAIERELESALWDLRPHWRTEKKPLFNARLETVATLPSFKNAFASRRAIVPMTGYFEWTGPKGDKQPHFVNAGGELLSAAGLYEVRKVDERWEVYCVVITRTGEDSAGEVHDRMPVFLTPDTWDQWLSPDHLSATARDGALSMLDHSSREVAQTLVTFTVDRKVNSTRTVDPGDPTLVQRVDV